MKRIYEQAFVTERVHRFKINDYFDTKDLEFFFCRFEKGELVIKPDNSDPLVLFASGEISVYFIREDGGRYSIAMDDGLHILGASDLLNTHEMPLFAEALSPVSCIALSLSRYRSVLLDDNRFLRLVIKLQQDMMNHLNMNHLCLSPLPERTVNYLSYFCSGGVLKGVEKAAFQLHCSPRQLQRVLNELAQEGIVIKIGKGSYRLLQQS